MKRYKNNIPILHRIFIVFFAAFVTFFVTFNQSIQQKMEKNAVETKIPAQEGENPSDAAQYSVVSSAAITPFFSLGTIGTSFIIFNYTIEKDIYVNQLEAGTFYINKYLEILFSRIISPNAP